MPATWPSQSPRPRGALPFWWPEANRQHVVFLGPLPLCLVAPPPLKRRAGKTQWGKKKGSPGGFAGWKNTQSAKKVLGVSRLHPHPPEARTHDLLVCWTASRPLGQGHHVYFSFLCFFVLFVVCFLCFVFFCLFCLFFLGCLCLLCRLCCLLWLFWLFYLSSLFCLVCPPGDSI